ncbi:MAG: glycoside hydrolase family 43 protein [Ruthenibacterium sp.]
MNFIKNPILKGFHPDPSILRVENDYYIATSTFEWFPGVAVYHSQDLVHWHFVTWPLSRVSQLDLRGVPSSCGIFAPCLSHADGVFYLVYTIVKTEGAFQDTENYLVTATDIAGEWSEPVYLNATGFDPSLFHDTDGRKWLVNRDCDTRGYLPDAQRGGILLREYDPVQKRLIGEEHRIYRSTKIIGAEGPHLYRHGAYYYLMLAEGGTDFNHVATVARSKKLFGPYECDPDTPMLSARDDVQNPLQKAGHASLVETQDGAWYIAHLVSRPLPNRGLCVLGRETALQKVRWTQDGWLRLAEGGCAPKLCVQAPALPPQLFAEPLMHDDFEVRAALGYPYQTLRVPLGEEIATLKERPGFLRLYGRDSLHSKYTQALVARRQQAFCYTAKTAMDYTPKTYHESAGLVCLYDTESFYYLYATRGEDGVKRVAVMASILGTVTYPIDAGVAVADGAMLFLKACVHYDKLQFYYTCGSGAHSTDTAIGPALDFGVLSDDFAITHGAWRFTGAFVGLCCQSFDGRDAHADFDYFSYKEDAED